MNPPCFGPLRERHCLPLRFCCRSAKDRCLCLWCCKGGWTASCAGGPADEAADRRVLTAAPRARGGRRYGGTAFTGARLALGPAVASGSWSVDAWSPGAKTSYDVSFDFVAGVPVPLKMEYVLEPGG